MYFYEFQRELDKLLADGYEAVLTKDGTIRIRAIGGHTLISPIEAVSRFVYEGACNVYHRSNYRENNDAHNAILFLHLISWCGEDIADTVRRSCENEYIYNETIEHYADFSMIRIRRRLLRRLGLKRIAQERGLYSNRLAA